jgi:predicted glycosyltransferase
MLLKKLLIDIGHPAQVHQFKYLYQELTNKGIDVLFSTKDKDIALYLLNSYHLPYRNLGRPKKGLIRKILFIPISCYRFFKIVRIFKPDIVLSRFSFHSSWVSFVLRIKHIGFTDTEHVGLADALTVPLVNVKLTAYSYQKKLGKNHLRYSGSIELFYLHQKRFTPNPNVLDLLGIKKNEKYVIIRFIAWTAHHDIGEKGLSLEMKKELINVLSKHAKVFISSENELPDDLEKYRIAIPYEFIHDAVYYSFLYVGEGASMASEAAILGVPAIYINSLTGGIIDEEEKAGILFRFTDGNAAIQKATQLIKLESMEEFR